MFLNKNVLICFLSEHRPNSSRMMMKPGRSFSSVLTCIQRLYEGVNDEPVDIHDYRIQAGHEPSLEGNKRNDYV